MSKRKPDDSRNRPFPWLCADCFTHTVTPMVMTHTAKVKHDGVIHELHLPDVEAPRCQTCGVTYPTDAVDDQVSDALRAKLRLLTPKQIQNEIKRVGHKQHEIAKQLGVTPESISRWATGALIQSRAMDNLLRLYFAFPEAREMVRRLYEDQQRGIEGQQASDESSDPSAAAESQKHSFPASRQSLGDSGASGGELPVRV